MNDKTTDFLLSVRGTHLDELFDETTDLSTSRGTSALYLDTVHHVDQCLILLQKVLSQSKFSTNRTENDDPTECIFETISNDHDEVAKNWGVEWINQIILACGKATGSESAENVSFESIGNNFYWTLGDKAQFNRELVKAFEALDTDLGVGKLLVTTISKGASEGIWKVIGCGSHLVDSLLALVKQMLNEFLANENSPYQLPFVTCAVRLSSMTEGRALRELEAASYWKEAQSTWIKQQGKGSGPCELSHIRAASDSQPIKGQVSMVNAQVAARRDYGRAIRRLTGVPAESMSPSHIRSLLPNSSDSKIERILGPDEVIDFPLHFESIGEPTGSLADRVAVIYMDGNQFGSHRETMDPTQYFNQLKQFDGELLEFRRSLLGKVFDAVVNSDAGVGPPTPDEADERKAIKKAVKAVIRLEVLLWGGDELMLIVPARLALSVTEILQKTCRTQAYNAANENKFPFHHAIGLVFCHSHTPISVSKRYAMGLAGLGKKHHPSTTSVTYDVIGDGQVDFDETLFIERRLPRGVPERYAAVPSLMPTSNDPNESAYTYYSELYELIVRCRIKSLQPAFPISSIKSIVRNKTVDRPIQSIVSDIFDDLVSASDTASDNEWKEIKGKYNALVENYGASKAFHFLIHLERLWRFVPDGSCKGEAA